jgi:hypothetical protein
MASIAFCGDRFLPLALSPTVTMKFSIQSTIFFAFTATAAQADNFVASCDANSVKVSGRMLTANCRNISGGLQCSKLDLNRCIKNNYGSLQADPTGSGYDTQMAVEISSSANTHANHVFTYAIDRISATNASPAVMTSLPPAS